jgi:hypothetical protein
MGSRQIIIDEPLPDLQEGENTIEAEGGKRLTIHVEGGRVKQVAHDGTPLETMVLRSHRLGGHSPEKSAASPSEWEPGLPKPELPWPLCWVCYQWPGVEGMICHPVDCNKVPPPEAPLDLNPRLEE